MISEISDRVGGGRMGDNSVRAFRRASMITLATLLLLPAIASAQSPWERAANNLALTFTGPLARSLALVAIVIGGVEVSVGEERPERPSSPVPVGGGGGVCATQLLARRLCALRCERRQ